MRVIKNSFLFPLPVEKEEVLASGRLGTDRRAHLLSLGGNGNLYSLLRLFGRRRKNDEQVQQEEYDGFDHGMPPNS
jgi:hypothetical protein